MTCLVIIIFKSVFNGRVAGTVPLAGDGVFLAAVLVRVSDALPDRCMLNEETQMHYLPAMEIFICLTSWFAGVKMLTI